MRRLLWTIGLLACGDPGLGSIPEGEPVFRNFDEGVECTLARNLAPTSVDEVQRAVRWASSRSLRVRAVSSERSCSENDIVCPGDEGVLLNLSGLNQVLEVDTDAQTIRVEPGVTVGEIGDALHDAGLSMRVNMPNRDFTAAGVIATGAHHTSLRFPSGMHDAVREIVLVDGRGDVVTLRDDEARGAAAHLGVLGIVVELTFQAEPELKTLHRVTSGDDMDFENRIVDMARAHDYASFSWFPSQGRWGVAPARLGRCIDGRRSAQHVVELHARRTALASDARRQHQPRSRGRVHDVRDRSLACRRRLAQSRRSGR